MMPIILHSTKGYEMEFNTLTTILADMYNNAPDGEAVAMIHLFGIRYSRDIQK